jgi:hypothetical protein
MTKYLNQTHSTVGKPKGKKLLTRPRHKWEDDIKMDLEEVEWERVDWIYWAQDSDK